MAEYDILIRGTDETVEWKVLDTTHPTINSLNNAINTNTNSIDNISTSGVGFPSDGNHVTTIQDWINHTGSSFVDSGFELYDNGNGTINLSAGSAILRDIDDTHTSNLIGYSISATSNISLNEGNNYIFADYNNGAPQISVYTSAPVHAGKTISICYIITRIGNNLNYINMTSFGTDYPVGNSKKDFFVYGKEWKPGGTIITSPSGNKLDITAGIFYIATVQIGHDAFDTTSGDTFTTCYLSAGGGAWVRTTGQVALDEQNYDDGSGTLQPILPNKWGVHWVYIALNNPAELIVVYGTESYGSVADAEASGIPSNLPPECAAGSTGVLIGKIITAENSTTAVDILSPFTTSFVGTQPTTHNNLGGLNLGDYLHLTSSEYSNMATQTDIVSLSGAIFEPAYGSIWMADNTNTMSITAAGVWTQVEDFNMVGPSTNTTPTTGSSANIQVDIDGDYEIVCPISFEGDANGDTYHFRLFKNDTIELPESSMKRKASNSDVGSGMVSGQISLSSTDKLSLKVKTEVTSSDIIIVNSNLQIKKLNN